jgi:hypothetical protein
MQHQQRDQRIVRRLLFGGLCLLFTTLQAEGLSELPVPDAYVARAIFTTKVVDREPVDQVVSVGPERDRILFYTDLRNLQGRTVSHRWEFEGQFIGEVEFKVGGPRWRVYSKKTLNPSLNGKWTVLVLDQSGWPLHASIFRQGEESE